MHPNILLNFEELMSYMHFDKIKTKMNQMSPPIVGCEMGFSITCKDGHELVNIDCRKSNLETYFSLEVYVALSVASLH
jgi:hypothetical protein